MTDRTRLTQGRRDAYVHGAHWVRRVRLALDALPEAASTLASMGDDVERTGDGHHIVVDGRKWRASDTGIPQNLRAELVSELMRARREVGRRGGEARAFVQDAKVALGERGEPWWETATDQGRRARLAATIRALLRHRDGTTICPSDAARVVGGVRWRDVVPTARAVAHDLAAQGDVVVQQKGETVDVLTARGPVRIAPGPALLR